MMHLKLFSVKIANSLAWQRSSTNIWGTYEDECYHTDPWFWNNTGEFNIY